MSEPESSDSTENPTAVCREAVSHHDEWWNLICPHGGEWHYWRLGGYWEEQAECRKPKQ